MTREDRKALTRRVLRLALPLMAANLSQTTLSLADTAMVGRIDTESVAAIGAAGILYLVLFLSLSATFMGIQAMVARRFGEERFEECGRVLDCGLGVALAAGSLAACLGWFAAEPLCHALYHEAEVAALAGDYLHIRWSGVLLVAMLWAFKGFYYGIGLTRLDMVITIGMNVLNVALNWILIFGHLGAPALGIEGAALASVIATGVATAAFIVRTVRADVRRRYRPFRREHWSLPIAARVARLSAPRAMQALAFGGSIVFFKLIADHCGEVALAASTVVWKFFGIPVLLAVGLGAASATVVGQELGAGRPERAESGAYAAVRLGIALNGVIALCVWLFPEEILRFFVPDDPAVVAAGIGPMRLLATFQIVDTAGIILARSLAGAGATLYVMAAEIVTSLCVMLPVAWFLVRTYPDRLTLVWITWAVYMVTWFLAMWTRFRGGSWKTIEV